MALVTFVSLGNFQVLEIHLSQGAQSIPNNTSVVGYTMQIRRTHSDRGKYWQSDGTSKATLNINGTAITVPNFSYDFRTATVKILATGSIPVSHTPNGSKTVAAYGSVTPTGSLPSGSAPSKNFLLTTIPRASSIGIISGNQIGSTITVNITRATTSFTHKVWYRMTSAQPWQLVTNTAGANAIFTIPFSVLSYVPNSTSGTLTIAIQTVHGGSNIGGEINKNHTMHVPESVVPSFTTITHSDLDAISRDTIGEYVQSKSRLAIAITGAVAGQSASLKSYRLTVDGQTLAAASGNTQAIKGSGTISIVGTVTDSRGRTASKTVSISVLAYSPPAITSVKFFRSDSSGIANDYGTFAKFELGYKITELNKKNSKTVRVRVGSNNTSNTPVNYVGKYEVQYGGFDVNLPYDISFIVTDLWGSSTSPQILPTGAVTMMWGRDSVAIGTTILKGSGTLNVKEEIYSNDVLVVALGGTIVDI